MSILEKSGILMSGRKNGHTDRRKLRLRGKLAIGVIIASIFLLLTLIKISTRTAFPIEKDAATRSQRSNVRSLLQLEDLVSSDTRPVIDGTTPTQKENECRDFHHLNISDVCAFINATADCLIGDGFINYVKVVYCSFSHLIPLGVITLTIWWLFLFAGLASTADEFFCPNLAVISKTLRLSQNIAGVTFLAFGNGAPDIFSSISAVGNAKDGDAGLAIGALVGAGIFVTTVVAGTISIVCPFTSMERPFLRDIVFYIGAVFWTFYVLYDGDISTAEAVGFICYYVVYVLLVVIGRAVYQYRKKATNSPKPDVPGITEDDLHGSIQAGAPTYGALDDDEVAILPPPIESRPQRAVKVALIPINGVFPVWGLVMILCSVFALVVSFTSAFDEIPKYHWVFAYAGFFVSVIWIYSIANEIVNLLQMFGVVFSISNAILGLTLLAWGNSVGDMIANTATARLGFPRMAISACFGGPLFNMLMGIGIPFTIGTIRHNGNFTLKFTLLQLVLICSLAGSLIMSLIAVPLRKFKFSAIYGGLLIAYYIVFLIIAVLVETQVITSSNAIFKQ
ncbi:mitochondrial sodium/calcium exchanger protein-like isoform X4 [Tubulanus polymorphus]|uniref:mitochondrial sodium/calcium exchanger protein-like isoform X4 n=1 Tax=Tubulanus polymorphus TaxID=672921 RepID=UPI003DA589EC